MSDTVLVAVIGAFATVLTALFQIFVSSRKAAASERPARNRLKSLAWTGVLLVAAAGGGFAWSEYLVLTRDARLAAFHERVGAVAQSGAVTALAPAAAASASATPIQAAVQTVPTAPTTPLQAALPAVPTAPAAATVTLADCNGAAPCTQTLAVPASTCSPQPGQVCVMRIVVRYEAVPAAEAPKLMDATPADAPAKPAG
jgi:hypothetical protein